MSPLPPPSSSAVPEAPAHIPPTPDARRPTPPQPRRDSIIRMRLGTRPRGRTAFVDAITPVRRHGANAELE
ncbi:hypothetical protein VTO73DRAFT_15448 [Trametes versicolor]